MTSSHQNHESADHANCKYPHHEILKEEQPLPSVEEPVKRKMLSIPIPRMPSIQAAILIFLIAVGLLQTLQLYALTKRVGSMPAATSASPTASAPANQSGSALPEMVGGC